MSDHAGLFDRILASLQEAAPVLGLAPPPATGAARARTTVRPVSNPGQAMRRDGRKLGERR